MEKILDKLPEKLGCIIAILVLVAFITLLIYVIFGSLHFLQWVDK